MSDVRIEPNPEQNHEGRQWGYTITVNGHRYAKASTGGTGACWNIDLDPGDPDEPDVHVCDLDELIEVLTALRNSDAHKANVAHWA